MSLVIRIGTLQKVLSDSDLVLSVDPQAIAYDFPDLPLQKARLRIAEYPGLGRVGRRLANRVLTRFGNFAIEERDFSRIAHETTETFLKMKDVLDHEHCLTESGFYYQIKEILKDKDQYAHKNYVIRREDQIEPLIRDCLLAIIDSIRTQGYRTDVTSSFATGGLGTAVIDRDGRLLRGPGASHRFAAARLVGLREGFPLRLAGAHADWLRQQGITGGPGYPYACGGDPTNAPDLAPPAPAACRPDPRRGLDRTIGGKAQGVG